MSSTGLADITAGEEVVEGIIILHFGRRSVLIIDGYGSLDKVKQEEFYTRMYSELGTFGIDKIDAFVVEVRWTSAGEVVKEAYHFMEKCTMTDIYAVHNKLYESIFLE